LKFKEDTVRNKEVEKTTTFLQEITEFNDYNHDNIGARIINHATYNVGDDKKLIVNT
jgi:hypothetical protein